MAEKTVRLRVLTPSQMAAEQEVDYVILRTSEGDMGILPGHEPTAALLSYGVVRGFVAGEQVLVLAVLGGFATVRNNEVTVLSAVAAPPDKLDETLSHLAQERAKNAEDEQKSGHEIQHAAMSLRRTLVKMDLGAGSIINTSNQDPDEAEDGGAES